MQGVCALHTGVAIFAILGVFELLDDNSPRCLVLVTRPAREEPGIGDAAGSSQAN